MMWLLCSGTRAGQCPDEGGADRRFGFLSKKYGDESVKKRAAMVDYILALLRDYEMRSPEKDGTADAVFSLLREIDGAQHVEDSVTQ